MITISYQLSLKTTKKIQVISCGFQPPSCLERREQQPLRLRCVLLRGNFNTCRKDKSLQKRSPLYVEPPFETVEPVCRTFSETVEPWTFLQNICPEPSCGTFEPLSVETFRGTLWDLVPHLGLAAPNHPEALLAETPSFPNCWGMQPQKFKAVLSHARRLFWRPWLGFSGAA